MNLNATVPQLQREITNHNCKGRSPTTMTKGANFTINIHIVTKVSVRGKRTVQGRWAISNSMLCGTHILHFWVDVEVGQDLRGISLDWSDHL